MSHVSVLVAVATLLCAVEFWSAGAMADSYSGKLHCDAVKLGPGPLNTSMQVTVKGNSLSYHREVFDLNGRSVGLSETGSGTIKDNIATLTGSMTEPYDQEVANYSGKMEGNRLTLIGQQVWNFPSRGVTYSRPCKAALTLDGAVIASAPVEYYGRIRCDAVPGRLGSLNTDINVTVTGSNIIYERKIMGDNGPTGDIERGSGTVKAGQITLASIDARQPPPIEATYWGTLHEDVIELWGKQTLIRSDGTTPFKRSCSANLKK
jgi:hypothetical protein